MASGVITGITSNKHIDSKIVWSSVPSAINNKSTVTASLYFRRNNSYTGTPTSGTGTFSITIDGQKGSEKFSFTVPNSGAWAKALTVTKTVSHNTNGTKSIIISASGSIPGTSLSFDYSGNAYLDKIDVSPPNFAGKPIVFSKITQTTVNVSFTSNDVLDKIEYSLNNQKTWIEINSKSFQIKGLSPNSSYTIYIKIRKKSNQKTKTSSACTFNTLPIYVTDITVDNDVKIDVGSSVNLNYSILPSNASIKKVEIKSSNNSIVSVDGNNLVALAKGTATITLTAQDGSGTTKSINVSTIQRVEGIITNQNEIVLSKTSSAKLQYTVLPQNADNKNVNINSSDESIVIIEGNTIVGVENGTATITISTEDGNYQVKILVSVFGEYVWFNYTEPLEILTAADVKHIKSNIATIRSMLLLKGYEVESLKEIYAETNTELNHLFDILQNIEYNLDVISDNDVKSIYYGEPKIIGEYASNREDIWRWLQVLNDMYNILNGSFGKWQYLLCKDGFPTIDGKKILVRGDFIG